MMESEKVFDDKRVKSEISAGSFVCPFKRSDELLKDINNNLEVAKVKIDIDSDLNKGNRVMNKKVDKSRSITEV